MRIGRSFVVASVALAAGLGIVGCSTGGGAVERPTEVVLDAEGDPAGLHHHRRWSDRIGQGAQPEGDVAFRNLAALGYTTVVSVDGARPDIEAAAKYGLRYVHVPIEYSGIKADEAARIVQAVRTSDGPVYVHCHHGLHRGPAGAMVARIAVDGITPEQATVELKESGCSPKYEGLYRDIAGFRAPTAEALAALPAELPSYVPPGDTAEHMAKMGRIFEGLQAAQKAGWKAPPESPDVNPPHQARILWEHFRELARVEESKSYGGKYLEWLDQSERAGVALEEALRASQTAVADAAMKDLKKTCDSCHKKHRDN